VGAGPGDRETGQEKGTTGKGDGDNFDFARFKLGEIGTGVDIIISVPFFAPKKQLGAPRLTRPLILRSLVGLRKKGKKRDMKPEAAP
jgi:hypothetical protein